MQSDPAYIKLPIGRPVAKLGGLKSTVRSRLALLHIQPTLVLFLRTEAKSVALSLRRSVWSVER